MRPGARSCSASAASRWSATARSGAHGIANQIRLAARAVEERTVARTEELIERSGVGRSAIRGGADGGA